MKEKRFSEILFAKLRIFPLFVLFFECCALLGSHLYSHAYRNWYCFAVNSHTRSDAKSMRVTTSIQT